MEHLPALLLSLNESPSEKEGKSPKEPIFCLNV